MKEKNLPIPPSLRTRPVGWDAVIATRRLEGLKLRTAGFSFVRIGKALGISDKTAALDLRWCLTNLAVLSKAKTEEYRELELSRIDSLIEVLTPRALTCGNLWATDRLLTCITLRSKLLGLDRPVKHEITGEIGVEHTHSVDDQLMARMRRLAGLSSESDPKNDEAKQIESTPAQELCADGEICQNPGGCNCK